MPIQKKIHDWTEADEALLQLAVADLEPLRQEYTARGIPARAYWSAVAGRLAPALLVTGKAACERWRTMQERKPPASEPDRWAEVEEMVLAYERDLQESTYDAAVNMSADMAQQAARLERLERKMDLLMLAWGIVP